MCGDCGHLHFPLLVEQPAEFGEQVEGEGEGAGAGHGVEKRDDTGDAQLPDVDEQKLDRGSES